MFSSILQLLFNAADIIVVGRFAGDNALAAVGSNTSIINLLCNLFIGLSVGANILAARQYGAGDREGLRQTVHTSILLSLLSGQTQAAQAPAAPAAPAADGLEDRFCTKCRKMVRGNFCPYCGTPTV